MILKRIKGGDQCLLSFRVNYIKAGEASIEHLQ